MHHPQWGQHDAGDKQMLTVTLAAVTSFVIIGHLSPELNGLPGLIVLDPERTRWDVKCVSAVVLVCVTSRLVRYVMLLLDVCNFRIHTYSLVYLGKTVSRRNVRRPRPSRSPPTMRPVTQREGHVTLSGISWGRDQSLNLFGF